MGFNAMADDDLAAKVADKLKGLTDALERRYAAATVILRHYLGESFIAECVCLSETPDPFMLNEFDESSDNRFVHMQRVCALADYLFILRDITGFDILLDRIVTRRPLRAPYFEARTASYFRTAGYALTVREERRVKREDFDFQAILNGEKINIEVTACTNAAFSEKNVSNILDEKRKQLPDDAPAAIYCIVPVEWFEFVSKFTIRSRRCYT